MYLFKKSAIRKGMEKAQVKRKRSEEKQRCTVVLPLACMQCLRAKLLFVISRKRRMETAQNNKSQRERELASTFLRLFQDWKIARCAFLTDSCAQHR